MTEVSATSVFPEPGQLPAGWRDVAGSEVGWPVAAASVVGFAAKSTDVDQLGHVNNVSYLRWLEMAAWRHAEKLGVGWPVYQQTGCAMVVHRHELDYLQPAMAGDELLLATWLANGDQKLRLKRAYQLRRASDNAVLLNGLSDFVCIDMASGRPRRMPVEFQQGYAGSY